MKTLGVIPARYGSTRLPAKPLKIIHGKPLLQWVIEGAKTSRKLDAIWVATDHPEIQALAEKCGVRAVMTSPEIPTGSDRVFAAARASEAAIVVNIQGDEPLVKGAILDALVTPLLADSTLEMATLGTRLKAGDLQSIHSAKIVLNQRGEALYFSRFPIPYSRVDAPGQGAVCLKHIGLYAFKKSFLAEFCAQPPTPLELAEGLEQLRALYLGARIRVVEVEHESVEVNVPEDVAKVEAVLKRS